MEESQQNRPPPPDVQSRLAGDFHCPSCNACRPPQTRPVWRRECPSSPPCASFSFGSCQTSVPTPPAPHRHKPRPSSSSLVVIPLLPVLSAFLLLLTSGVHATDPPKQVVLLDTTGETSLDWTKYPFGPQAPTPGWIEESFTDFPKGINWRSYVVCDVAYSDVNNWLWTPFVEKRTANRLYIEVKFSMRDCSLFPGTALSCKETFSLLYYEFDVATKEPPPWQLESYKLVDRIAADEGRFTQSNSVIFNTEIRSIPVTKKGVYFAFRDQGACISLLAIKIYYISCPRTTVGLATFEETPAGPELTSIVKVKGECVRHAVLTDRDSSPTFLCKADGTWKYLSGGCVCQAGYEADDKNQTCKVCPVGRYNPKEGLTPCIPCPPHSSAPTPGLSECVCDTGYYRAPTDPRDTPCTRPPSAPQNLTVNFVDQSTVILSWNPPFNNGGRRDVVFRVRCDACKPGVTFNPDQFRYDAHNETTVTISGLQPVTTYRFQVFAENGVSDQGGPPKDVDLTVTTEAQVSSMVRDVRVVDIKSNEMELAWDPPVEPYGVDVELYEVRYFVRGQENNSSSVLTTQERSSFPNLTQRTEYGFQVRTKTTHGWGEFSPPVYKTTGHVLAAYVDSVESTEVRLIIGITATVVVIAILGVICGVVVWRTKSNDDCNKKGVPSDCDTLEYRNGEVHAPLETPPIMASHTSTMTTPLFTQMGPPRTYVDPHTYEDPSLAVKDFAREIDASCINIEAIIGGGEFGDVCRGKLKYPGRPEITVAIKTLKPGSSDRAKRDFLSEASSMGQFEHPNVIYLQGVVTKSTPHMIITEFMENGSLDAFLRANDGKFQTMQLSAMLRGIASGMAYLSEMNYVHRDLAARNVLVNAQLVCKIADFGLSREVESTTEGAYTTRGGKIPVRWTAPEAIAFRKFTWASDVWSFGIVSWEVMSYGERPYWNWSNQDVIKAIERGYRLPAPMDCPEAIHQLMLDCWQKERTHRPSFPAIVQTLDRLIRCPETLRKVAPNRPHHNPLAPDVPDLTQIGSVPEWLDSLKMSRYAQSFERAGITCMDHVARLSLQDLQVMGITLVGHQKKILNSVQTMRAQISLNMSDGFLV